MAETYNIVLFNIKGRSHLEVSKQLLNERGICVRAGLHCAPIAHKIGTYPNCRSDKLRCVQYRTRSYTIDKRN